MKISLAALFCLFFSFGVFAQTTQTLDKDTVKVENITLMRDDGSGDPGAETENFKTTDRPIHFQIQLDSFIPAVVKLILMTEEVKGLKSGMKILTVSYKTDGEQNIVNFKGSPKAAWLPGKYKIEVYIDNKLAGEKALEIEKPNVAPAKQTNLSSPKLNAKPRKMN